MSAQTETTVTVPFTEATRLIAREAGEAAARQVIESHIAECPARKLAEEIRGLRNGVVVAKKTRHWLHVAAATIVGGALYAGGEYFANRTLARIDPMPPPAAATDHTH